MRIEGERWKVEWRNGGGGEGQGKESLGNKNLPHECPLGFHIVA